MSNFVTRLLANFSDKVVTPTPIAMQETTIDSANATSVQFGFSAPATANYRPDQTYHAFVQEQARLAGVSLQANYIAKFKVGDTEHVVESSLTFAELNAKYNTSNEPVSVVIPNPERAVGRNG